jgi:hypothetical protein
MKITEEKFVFNYEDNDQLERKLVRVYKMIGESETHVCVRKGFLKKWFPKGDHWRTEVILNTTDLQMEEFERIFMATSGHAPVENQVEKSKHNNTSIKRKP